jgi:hypothetical protein
MIGGRQGISPLEFDMHSKWKASGRAERLIEFLRMHRQVVPAPKYWEKLYLVLAEEAERRGRTAPPAPLTHGLEIEVTPENRRQRLIEQIVWADRNSLLHRVQQVLDTIPTSGWELEKGRK